MTLHLTKPSSLYISCTCRYSESKESVVALRNFERHVYLSKTFRKCLLICEIARENINCSISTNYECWLLRFQNSL